MHSWFSKCMDTQILYTGVGNIRIILCALLVMWCLGIFVKHTLKRRYYMNIYPCRKFGLFNPWGNITDVWKMGKLNDIRIHVYIMQAVQGYMQLFKDEDFFYVSLGYCSFINLNKAKVVEELISGTKNIEKNWLYSVLHPWLATGLLTSHGSKWKSRRKLLTPAFHFDILKDFLPIFNKQSQLLVELLDKETKRPWVDITEPIKLCSLDIICETILGVSTGAQKDSEQEYVKAVSRASDTIMNRLAYPPYYLEWYFFLTKEGSQFKKDVKLLHDFTRGVITDKKQKLLNCTQEMEVERECKKRKSFIDLLLQQHIENKALTEEDIQEEVDTFVFEGHDTTAAGITWALYLIGLYKDVQEKVHEEIDRVFGDDYERFVTTDDLKDMEYIERVLKESQRIYPSVPFFARNLSEDTILCGQKIPKDIGVAVLPYILHRDETVFPNPEKFDPDRFLPENCARRSPFAYIPFSAGPRNCIGQRFALMEEKVVVVNILRNYTLESLDPRDKVPAIVELILRSTVPIRIKLRPRNPASQTASSS